MRNRLPGGVSFEEARGKRILVALSGGADSVALLRLICLKREEQGLTVFAAHFNHGLRGVDADADEAFCKLLCRENGVELICGRADVNALARQNAQGLETAARDARYRFLYETAERCGAELIALAHHADDQAETVLMHLLRGSGLEGACGMARLNGKLYRPLLNIPKRALTAYLDSIGQSWCEDLSNRVSDNPRNALRNEILPRMEAFYPAASAALVRFAENVRADEELLERMTNDFMTEHVERGAYGVRITDCENAEEAVLRRCLRRLCGRDLDQERCNALVGLCRQRRGKTDIDGRHFAERTPGALYILPKDSVIPGPVPLNTVGETVLPGICRIAAIPGGDHIDPDDPSVEIVDAGAFEGAFLRTRRAGDRITLPGTKGDMLLSDRFTDRKTDRPLRDHIPLIARGSEVLWAWGEGLSTQARVHDGTKSRLTLKIERLK